MAKIAVVFESRYGQSAKIADHVADLARRRGHDARIVHASIALDMDFEAEDALVVVAPIYYGRHPRAMESFIRSRADLLSHRPSAYLAVSGAAGSAARVERAQAERRAKELVAKTGACPRVIASVGGAMAYPRYNIALRWVIKRISQRRGGPTDTSRVHETTDWPALDATVSRFLQSLAPVHGSSGGVGLTYPIA